MLPPTEASASDWLRGKPAPQSCREKRLGTWVCFTRESKKGSRESSGCGRKRQGVNPHTEGLNRLRAAFCLNWKAKARTWGMFLGKDHLEVPSLVERGLARDTGDENRKVLMGPQISRSFGLCMPNLFQINGHSYS